MLTLEAIVFIFMGLLGLDLIRRCIRWLFPAAENKYLDLLYILFVVIGALLYFPKATALRQTKEELTKTKEELTKVKRRESLRQWAMLLPTGEEAYDVMGIRRGPPGNRSKEFGKVFIPSDKGGIKFGGQGCEDESYIANIQRLINKYDKSPYPYVALAWCLKLRRDPSWRKAAAQAKEMLEVLMSIEPHVIAIDSFYGMVVKNVLEEKTKLEDTGFFVLEKEGYYRPKNLPPD